MNQLIDTPEAGVDAARIAAEAGRDLIRGLIESLGKEITRLQSEQTNSRIVLTTPLDPHMAPKSGHGWLLGRGHARAALADKLIEHGLLSLEELLYELVRWQLRAIESHISASIDQILNLWLELRQLGKWIGAQGS